MAQLPPTLQNARCRVENEHLEVTLQRSLSCSLVQALVLIYVTGLIKLKALVATSREVTAACMCPAGPWQAGPGLVLPRAAAARYSP